MYSRLIDSLKDPFPIEYPLKQIGGSEPSGRPAEASHLL